MDRLLPQNEIAAETLPDPAGRVSQGRALYNLKARDPSRLMQPSDGGRYRCVWLERSITLHSDGNVTCGLDDPYGLRSFGNVHRQSVAEIFANPEYAAMQQKLWEGHRCIDCHLSQPAAEDAPRCPAGMGLHVAAFCPSGGWDCAGT